MFVVTDPLGAMSISPALYRCSLVALAAGLLATPQRKWLARPWVYWAALLAAVMVLPNVLWQQSQGWPFMELGKAGASGKNIEMSPLQFFVQQIVLTGPMATAVWLGGLWAGVFRPRIAVARALPIAWLILLVVFDASHGKAYYLCAIYPTLLGFGAVRIEEWIANTRARAAVLMGVVILGALAAPFTLPILPVDSFIRYQRALGLEKRQRLMCSVATWACRPPSAGITITTCGDLAITTAVS